MKCRKCHKEIEDLKICPYCKGKQIVKDIESKSLEGINICEDKISKLGFLSSIRQISIIIMILMLLKVFISVFTDNVSFLDFILKNCFNFCIILYFYFINKDCGKRKFNYSNLIIFIIFCIQFIKSILEIFVVVNILNILNIVLSILLLLFFTRVVYSDKIKSKILFNLIDNKVFFYLIFLSSLFCFLFSELSISYNIILVTIINILCFLGNVLISRYIYLLSDNKSKEVKSLFKSSDSIDFSVIKDFVKKFNIYQLSGIFVGVIGIIISIYLGSINTTQVKCVSCVTSSYPSFSYSTMFISLGLFLFTALFLYWMGDIINILRDTKENSPKKVKKSVKSVD